MSFFINDTLQRQIERGEVFFNFSATSIVGAGSNVELLFNVGAKRAVLLIDPIVVGTTVTLSGYFNATASAAGVSIPMYNMDISSSKTLLTAVTIGPTLTDIGTWKALSRYPHGKESRFSPFNRESGIILPANEEFYLVIKNSDECSLEISYNFFLREID